MEGNRLKQLPVGTSGLVLRQKLTVLDAGLSTLKSFFVNFELYCGEMSGGGRPETMVEQENRRETREDAKKRRPQTESLNRITKCPLDTAEYHNPPPGI